MRTNLLAGIAIGIAVLVAPAAHAANPDLVYQGCNFNTDQQATVTGGMNVGLIGDLSATTDAGGVPVDATVTCWIQVNGVEAPGTRFSYSGLGTQQGFDRISFATEGSDTFDLCQSVLFADQTTQTECPVQYGDRGLEPLIVYVENLAFNGVFVDVIDSAVCPHLVALAGTYGPITIGPDGDVYVADPLGLGINPVYDCPPYISV